MTAGLIANTPMQTAADLERTALGVAAVLRERGLRAGDRVLLRADNSAGYAALLLALMHLDASIVLLDHRQTAGEVRRVQTRAAARWTVADRGADLGPDGSALVVDDLLEIGPVLDGRLRVDAWSRRDDALIAWSSGSTGQPKGIVRSGRSLLDNLEATRQRMGYTSDDVLLPLLPFSHQYGLSLVLLSWLTGCSLVVAPYLRIDAALRAGAAAGATAVDATPATYRLLADLVERRPEALPDLGTVQLWCVGGAPLDPALADRFARLIGRPLLDGYGSTEAGNIALATLDNPIGCGRPLDGVEVRILDNGRVVAPGEVGELWVRSPGLLTGYLAEDGAVVRSDAEWFGTEDLGYRDAHGDLVVLGRKRAVHRLGHTLYPEVLERKAEACGRPIKVVPVDDERRGSQLVFFVEDPAGGDARSWRRAISALLPSYEQPNQVRVLERFPVNANGKTDAAALERMAVAAAPAAPLPERSRAIRAVAAALRAQSAAVTEILTEVSNRRSVELELAATLATLDGAADEVATYRPARVDRVAVFMPSNIVLYSYALYLLVPSLYAERIVFRPSSRVADQAARVHELLAPVHGLPIELAAVSQRDFVDGPAAAADVVVFTGAYQNAEQIRARLRPDQLLLFLGQGVNPFVVTPTADIEHAVHDAVRIRLLNSGQDCLGPDVFFVHTSVMERFLATLVARLCTLTFGDYRDPRADYGPLFYDTALEAAAACLHQHRNDIVHGGRVDFRARHVEPTVLLRRPARKLALPELFSPIFNLVPYDDPAEVRRRITSGPFVDRALGASVYGDDAALVADLGKRHTVSVDTTLFDVEDGNRPFGGYGLEANYIAHQGRRRAEPVLLSKAVADHLGTSS